jgi:hypothetical protein
MMWRIIDSHHDDTSIRVAVSDTAEQSQAVHAGHQNIGQYDIVGAYFQPRESFLATPHEVGVPLGAGEQRSDERINFGVVVNHQNGLGSLWVHVLHRIAELIRTTTVQISF